MRRAVFAMLATLAVGPAGQDPPRISTDSAEQIRKLADAFRANSYPISLASNGLSGQGAEFLRRHTADAQFVLIGEEHNVKEVPEFTTALFSLLHECCRFDHLALENDPVSAHLASATPMRGDMKRISEYAASFPNAFTFATDQELQMIAEVGAISSARSDPVWGLDQSFGVLHALERVRALGGSAASPMFEKLLAESTRLDSARFASGSHYMSNVVRLEDLQKLQQEVTSAPGSEVEFILSNLVSSSRIYTNYWRATKGERTGYVSGFEREEQMKTLFLRGYRNAQNAGELAPKAVVKLGHWHVFRGLGPSGLQTLGNFATEFATANGHRAFTIAVGIHGSSNRWREIGEQDGMQPIGIAASPTAWTVLDFRPVREAVAAGEFGSPNANLRRYLYGFDAAVIIAGGSPATQSVVKSEGAR